MEKIFRFFRLSLFSFKALFGWLDPKVYVLVKVINPIFFILFFVMLVRFVYQSDDVTPYIIGNAMVLCFYNGIFGVGYVLAAERFSGTLEPIVVAPINSFTLFFGRGLFHILDGFITVLIGLIVGAIIFGIQFHGSILQLITILLISSYSVVGLGLTLASMGLKFRDMNMIANTIAMALLAFTGANFPVDRLPQFLQVVSSLLPLTRGITAARLTAAGHSMGDISHLLLSEFAIGTFYIFLGYFMFLWMKRLAHKDGAFEMY